MAEGTFPQGGVLSGLLHGPDQYTCKQIKGPRQGDLVGELQDMSGSSQGTRPLGKPTLG